MILAQGQGTSSTYPSISHTISGLKWANEQMDYRGHSLPRKLLLHAACFEKVLELLINSFLEQVCVCMFYHLDINIRLSLNIQTDLLNRAYTHHQQLIHV